MWLGSGISHSSWNCAMIHFYNLNSYLVGLPGWTWWMCMIKQNKEGPVPVNWNICQCINPFPWLWCLLGGNCPMASLLQTSYPVSDLYQCQRWQFNLPIKEKAFSRSSTSSPSESLCQYKTIATSIHRSYFKTQSPLRSPTYILVLKPIYQTFNSCPNQHSWQLCWDMSLSPNYPHAIRNKAGLKNHCSIKLSRNNVGRKKTGPASLVSVSFMLPNRF